MKKAKNAKLVISKAAAIVKDTFTHPLTTSKIIIERTGAIIIRELSVRKPKSED